MQPVATATAIEAAKVASAATLEVRTSAAKPASWIDHVSVFCRVRISGSGCVELMLVLCACSPTTLAWWNQAKLSSRWNRRGTVCVLTWSNSAVSLFDSVREVLLRCFTLSFVNYVLPSTSGDKKSAESRVKELEEALAAQRAESKKALDAAKDSSALRERGYAERLASLVRDV